MSRTVLPMSGFLERLNELNMFTAFVEQCLIFGGDICQHQNLLLLIHFQND